jgi:hypothetical protein
MQGGEQGTIRESTEAPTLPLHCARLLLEQSIHTSHKCESENSSMNWIEAIRDSQKFQLLRASYPPSPLTTNKAYVSASLLFVPRVDSRTDSAEHEI